MYREAVGKIDMTSWDLTSAFVDTEVWCCHACGRQMFYNPAPRPLASKLSWERCPTVGSSMEERRTSVRTAAFENSGKRGLF